MSYSRIQNFYHVTTQENKESICREQKFNLNRANDPNYDRELFFANAPRVVYFSASYWNSRLPNISPYPRCYGKCSLANSKYPRQASRLLVNCEYIANRIDEYSVYKISSIKKEYNTYVQTLLFFVNKKDLNTINWCNNNLEFKKYDITRLPRKDADENKLIPIFVSNGAFYSLDMASKNVINIAFSEDFQLAFQENQIKFDTVKHRCITGKVSQ